MLEYHLSVFVLEVLLLPYEDAVGAIGVNLMAVTMGERVKKEKILHPSRLIAMEMTGKEKNPGEKEKNTCCVC